MTYGDLMDDLKQCWKKVDTPAEPANDDECWVHTFEDEAEEEGPQAQESGRLTPIVPQFVIPLINQW